MTWRRRCTSGPGRDAPQAGMGCPMAPGPGGSGAGHSQTLGEKTGGDVTGPCGSTMTAAQRLPTAVLTNNKALSATPSTASSAHGCPPSNGSMKPAATSLGLSSRHQSSTTVPSGNFILRCGFFSFFFLFFSLKRLKRRF